MKSLRGIFYWSVPLFIVFLGCPRRPSPSFWPQNGYRFEDMTWEVSLSDSSSILINKGGCWILPSLPDGNLLTLTSVTHQKSARKPYHRLLGRVDQEVSREAGPILREFYRFDGKGILLLGCEGADSASLLTIYTPPLVLFPNHPDLLDTTFLFESKPEIWNARTDTVRPDFTTRIRLTLKQKGTVLLHSFQIPAILCKMSISQDRTVGFGGTDLIVPDAVMMENNVLLADGIGPVLEWGIRSRAAPGNPAPGKEHTPLGPGRTERTELYYEVTLHRTVQAGQ
jgi:hypothetical protein